ncbi:MAG: hypothetical protein ABJA60_04165 [Nitrosospira sp.]
MAEFTAFKQYYLLADQLIAQSKKEQLAECMRLLALNLAHYQITHGEIPLSATLTIVEETEPNEAQLKLLAQGMENLVGVLGTVMRDLSETWH